MKNILLLMMQRQQYHKKKELISFKLLPVNQPKHSKPVYYKYCLEELNYKHIIYLLEGA
jgi:hypothetical protein